MSGKSINFEDKKINKSNFYKSKKIFNIYDLDVNKILVSKKESNGTKNSLKYFIGYNDNDGIRPLKWERVSNLMNINFDSEPVYGDNDKYIDKNKNVWG